MEPVSYNTLVFDLALLLLTEWLITHPLNPSPDTVTDKPRPDMRGNLIINQLHTVNVHGCEKCHM